MKKIGIKLTKAELFAIIILSWIGGIGLGIAIGGSL